ncbi:MAG: hypothetical protein ACI8Z7_000532 [Candidatus Nanohaloarchaea archaeon]|jgi:hypothetical protein
MRKLFVKKVTGEKPSKRKAKIKQARDKEDLQKQIDILHHMITGNKPTKTQK